MLILSLTMMAAMAVPALAADYRFESGNSTWSDFGTSTSTDNPVRPDPMNDNTRRNKDAAFMPPPFGIFSGDIPTNPSSPYHDNLPQSGFIPVNQELPPIGNEDYAPGSSEVSTGFLPTTSQTSSVNTMPWFYDDGSMGTLFVARTNSTIKVYSGETDANLAKGAGHFSTTSAWDGNVALAGHNRGNAGYFSFVKDLQLGDKLTYTTRYGTRTYEVISKTQIDEWDNRPLAWSSDNLLTLITCVENVPGMRYSVVAREIR